MSNHIFISYSHDDSDFVNKLANDLLDHHYDVWMDTLNLPGGVKWKDDIMAAVDDCAYFLVVWSANMEGSGFSRKEVDRALSGNKKIIPLMLSSDHARMWSDLKSLQWIDFQTSFDDGWQKLIQEIPLPAGVQAPPNLKDTLKRGELTFGSAARLWRSKLIYRVDGKNDTVGLLIERSQHGINSYLVGRQNDKITTHPAIQVFLNFSGTIDRDRFEDYLEYALEHESDTPLWTVLVRGPMTTTPRGLEYSMPYKRAVWDEALAIAWRAVAAAGTDRIPIHLYTNAPVALVGSFCGSEHFRRGLSIYQINLQANDARNRYFLAYNNALK